MRQSKLSGLTTEQLLEYKREKSRISSKIYVEKNRQKINEKWKTNYHNNAEYRERKKRLMRERNRRVKLEKMEKLRQENLEKNNSQE